MVHNNVHLADHRTFGDIGEGADTNLRTFPNNPYPGLRGYAATTHESYIFLRWIRHYRLQGAYLAIILLVTSCTTIQQEEVV